MSGSFPVPGRDFASDSVAKALSVWAHSVSEQRDTDAKAVSSRAHDVRFGARLHDHPDAQNSPVLTLTFPRLHVNSFVGWLGRRILYWPDGIEERHRISLVSSRPGERRDLHGSWFDALRTATVRCDPQRECLCIAAGTAASDAAERAALLFGIPSMALIVDAGKITEREELLDWVRSVDDLACHDAARSDTTVFSFSGVL